jgi:hypothetical protein
MSTDLEPVEPENFSSYLKRPWSFAVQTLHHLVVVCPGAVSGTGEDKLLDFVARCPGDRDRSVGVDLTGRHCHDGR